MAGITWPCHLAHNILPLPATAICYCLQGLVLFVTGNLVQFQTHYILASLASSSGTRGARGGSSSSASSGSKGKAGCYRVPYGGLFGLVSCPHYLAEVVLYLGLAVGLHMQTNALLILAWVVSDPPATPVHLPCCSGGRSAMACAARDLCCVLCCA